MQPLEIVRCGDRSNDPAEGHVAAAGRLHSIDPPLEDRATLQRWVRGHTTPQRVVLRSRVVLLLADGLSARAVARRLEVSRHTVDLWRRRYLAEGCNSLTHDRPGRGRKRSA